MIGSGKRIERAVAGIGASSVSPTSRGRRRFVVDESGASMTEYALLLLLVAMVVMTVAKLIGQNVLPLYSVGSYL
jgi:Flp pilus assembly pilin Flp